MKDMHTAARCEIFSQSVSSSKISDRSSIGRLVLVLLLPLNEQGCCNAKTAINYKHIRNGFYVSQTSELSLRIIEKRKHRFSYTIKGYSYKYIHTVTHARIPRTTEEFFSQKYYLCG